jgi:tRNA(Ile)-lysidine synthase
MAARFFELNMQPLPERIELQVETLLGSRCRELGLVAVSGGADSIALLHLLADRLPQTPLAVVHLNHQLRGAESDGDQAFVEALAERLDLLCYVESAPLGELARESKENLEDLARQHRYSFFQRVAERVGATWVATGHTADDQAETVLHRLIRGAGVQGLRGIAVRRKLESGLLLIRPLLSTTRGEIVQYLESLSQEHREDSSNQEIRFTRNRIRKELLPLLKQFNPQMVNVLTRLAEECEERFNETESSAQALLHQSRLPDAGAICILDASNLMDRSESQIREMLRYLWRLQNWPRGKLTRDHWKTMAKIARGEGTAIDLPDGLRLQRRGQIVQVGPIGSA